MSGFHSFLVLPHHLSPPPSQVCPHSVFQPVFYVPPSMKEFEGSLWQAVLFWRNHMVLSAWLPGLMLCCPSGKVLPFCKFHELKRVIRQNSLQASSDLVIDILCQYYSFCVIPRRVCIMSLPCKTKSKVCYGNDDQQYRVMYENYTGCCLEGMVLGFNLQHFEWVEDGGMNWGGCPQELSCNTYLYKFWKVSSVRF